MSADKNLLGGISNNPDFLAGLVYSLEKRVDAVEAVNVDLRARLQKCEHEVGEAKKAFISLFTLVLEMKVKSS